MNRILDTTTFAALGTRCTFSVSVSALELPLGRRAAAAAQAEVEACERALSRFDDDSDLSRANRAAGTWISVDERLVDALTIALELRDATGRLCDPTLLPALIAAGYDRSFELLATRPPRPTTDRRGGGVEIDRTGCQIRLAAGTAIDLGATAKGWIAGRALAAARRAWPALPGALIDLGGDIAVVCTPPRGDHWLVDVEDPRSPAGSIATLRLAGGGVATSGPARRRFGPGGSLHHLLDPATCEPALHGPLAVTVVAADPAAADAHATALAITPVDGAAAYVAARPELAALLVLTDGTVVVYGDLDVAVPPKKEVAA
jgi:FAD:protein FMN transferase